MITVALFFIMLVGIVTERYAEAAIVSATLSTGAFLYIVL